MSLKRLFKQLFETMWKKATSVNIEPLQFCMTPFVGLFFQLKQICQQINNIPTYFADITHEFFFLSKLTSLFLILHCGLWRVDMLPVASMLVFLLCDIHRSMQYCLACKTNGLFDTGGKWCQRLTSTIDVAIPINSGLETLTCIWHLVMQKLNTPLRK